MRRGRCSAQLAREDIADHSKRRPVVQCQARTDRISRDARRCRTVKKIVEGPHNLLVAAGRKPDEHRQAQSRRRQYQVRCGLASLVEQTPAEPPNRRIYAIGDVTAARQRRFTHRCQLSRQLRRSRQRAVSICRSRSNPGVVPYLLTYTEPELAQRRH